ncbi:hypothetical protein ACFLZ9_02115 [Patescibacteria group bacterium]
MMEVKGGTIKNTPLFVKETFGEEACNKWLDSLPAESQNIFRKPILSSVWYPYKWGAYEPQKKIVEMFYGGDPKKAAEMGRYSTEKSLKGIYKMFLKLIASAVPSAGASMVNRIQQTFSAFMRPIKLENAEPGNSQSNLRIVEFSEVDEIAEYGIAGCLEKAIEIMMGKKPEVNIVKSMARGDECTEYEIKM